MSYLFNNKLKHFINYCTDEWLREVKKSLTAHQGSTPDQLCQASLILMQI